MATRKRKTFDPSLKVEVVRMIKEQGQGVQNVSESMSIGQTAIRRWLTQYGAEQIGQSGIGKPLTDALQAGLRRVEHGHSTAAAGTGFDSPFRPGQPGRIQPVVATLDC